MTQVSTIDSEDIDTPLLVDLDGSLIATDSLIEGLIVMLKRRPWLIFHALVWLFMGKAHLKHQVYKYSFLDIKTLPVREEVEKFVAGEAAKGRETILCSGCWHELAEDFREIFPFFSSVIASDQNVNLTGSSKAEMAVNRWGKHGFDYIGNESKDIAIWKVSRKAHVVGGTALRDEANTVSAVAEFFQTRPVDLKVWLKAMRVHQWAKNALIFVPLLTSHKVGEIGALTSIVFGFIALNCCASATYLMNDALDLDADRRHKIKKERPFASGTLPLKEGLLVAAVLLLGGLLIAYVTLGNLFLAVLLAYLILTVLYSFKLKSLQTIDVITLASLFTIRVIAGAAAIQVELSFWLLCFSMFIFLSLAMVKRVAELIRVEGEAESREEKISGRGYFTADIVILQCLGGTSGFLAVLVFALYINSESVVPLYQHPEILWLICPILGYWVMRIWMLAARGQMNEDPISFAITDWNSWLAAILSVSVVAIASIV